MNQSTENQQNKSKNTLSAHLFILFIIIALSFSASCTYEKEDELVNNECDTINISFNTVIKPIFDTNCAHCHNAISLKAGFNINEFSELTTRVESGLLIDAINREVGAPQMPYDADKLPDCTIAKIKAWKNKGMPND